MPQLTMEIPHELGRDEAARRLKEKFESARHQYVSQVENFREEWTDHTFAFGFQVIGMAVSGKLAVEEKCVKLDTTLPMAAMFFKGAIESRVRSEVSAMLQ